MKAKSINPASMMMSLTAALIHGQFQNMYKEHSKTVRDLILLAASLIFFICTMYYAISSRKSVSSQTIEHKIQNHKSPKKSI